jgi:hypothetical protein
MTSENWKELSPVGLWAALAHAFSVLALGAGKVVWCGVVYSALLYCTVLYVVMLCAVL